MKTWQWIVVMVVVAIVFTLAIFSVTQAVRVATSVPQGFVPIPVAPFHCVCTKDLCLNNAVLGRRGQVQGGMLANSVVNNYGPCRTGCAETGWKCYDNVGMTFPCGVV